jgi:hypothetical protein
LTGLLEIMVTFLAAIIRFPYSSIILIMQLSTGLNLFHCGAAEGMVRKVELFPSCILEKQKREQLDKAVKQKAHSFHPFSPLSCPACPFLPAPTHGLTHTGHASAAWA